MTKRQRKIRGEKEGKRNGASVKENVAFPSCFNFSDIKILFILGGSTVLVTSLSLTAELIGKQMPSLNKPTAAKEIFSGFLIYSSLI